MSHTIECTYEIYDERHVKARKEHTCAACHETIRVGHRYTRVFLKWGGEIEVILRCLRCQTIHEHLRELGEGETWPSEVLGCGEEYERHWGREPPPEIAALAFALQGET